MRVFVDTSVWIDFFRGRDATLRAGLGALLDEDRVAIAAAVRVELLGGARKEQAARLQRLLTAVPTFRPTDATWDTMEAWAVRGARAGERFGVGDLLIGATAAEHGSPLWSLDADFARLAALGVLALHEPG